MVTQFNSCVLSNLVVPSLRLVRVLKAIVSVLLIRPDNACHSVRVLRDGGALQSLVSSELLHYDDFVHTGKTQLLCGITGDVISVLLVEITLDSPLFSGTYVCGLFPAY